MGIITMVLQSMVWNKDKMKRDQAGALRPSQQKTGTAQSAQQHRDKEIYKRAVNHYTRRKDRECEENAKVGFRCSCHLSLALILSKSQTTNTPTTLC